MIQHDWQEFFVASVGVGTASKEARREARKQGSKEARKQGSKEARKICASLAL